MRTPRSLPSKAIVLKWRYKTGGPVESSPAIGPDGTIYLGCDGNPFPIGANGTP